MDEEVFANFMADKSTGAASDKGVYDLKFLTTHFPAAYSVDRTLGANPIRQVLDNLQNAGMMYGPIIYSKAPIMMRQLELLTGEENFRKGIGNTLKNMLTAMQPGRILLRFWTVIRIKTCKAGTKFG
jgi:aminopeptidase N